MLAGQLNVPIFALAEHALEISCGLIAKVTEKPEDREEFLKHLERKPYRSKNVGKDRPDTIKRRLTVWRK